MIKQKLKEIAPIAMGMLSVFFLGLITLAFTDKAEVQDGQKRPLWVDMVTPDMAKTQKFYGDLLGWQFIDKSRHGFTNYLIQNGDQVVGSIFEIEKAKAAVWIPAAHVNAGKMRDKTKLLENKSAKIAIAGLNMPGRGDQIMYEAPFGEEFSLMTNNSYHENEVYNHNQGSLMGTELWSDDVQKSSAFYRTAFDVSVVEEDFDDKPYWFFERDGVKLAGMIQNPIDNQSTQWVSYFFVDDIEKASQKAKDLGGFVALAPDKNVREGKVAVIEDPNGAIFCLFANH